MPISAFGGAARWALAAVGVAPSWLFCLGGLWYGWRAARRAGVAPAALGRAVRQSARASVPPGLAGVLGVAVMAGYVGGPLAWLRLSAAGALPYELAAATLTAGRALARLTPALYAASALIATIGMLPGPLLCLGALGFYLPGQHARRSGRRWGWLGLLACTAATLFAAFGLARLAAGPLMPAAAVPGLTVRLQKSLCRVAVLYWPGAVAEFLLCAPLLGRAACWVGFLTGSVGNVRLPCVLEARAEAAVLPGTPAGEAVSLAAVSASAGVTLGVTAAGTAVLAPFMGALSAMLRPYTGAVQAAVFALYAAPAVRCALAFVRRRAAHNKKAAKR